LLYFKIAEGLIFFKLELLVTWNTTQFPALIDHSNLN